MKTKLLFLLAATIVVIAMAVVAPKVVLAKVINLGASGDTIYVSGNLGIGTSNPGSYGLNITGNAYVGGTMTATAFSGPLSGTISAGNVSAGTFGANTGGGSYTFPGNLYFNNYGIGVVGTYSDVRYQGVFAMGDAYKLPADGTTPGSLYGIAWTHSNIGGQSKAGLSHQALFMENGATKTAIGTGIWTAGNLYLSGQSNYLYSDGTYITASNYLRAGSGIYSDGWMQSVGWLYTNTGVIQANGAYIYPGRTDGGGSWQTSWYLASNASWGLYSNTSFNAAGGLYDAGVRVCRSDGTNCSFTISNADTVDSLHAASFSRKDTTGQWIKPYYEYGSYLTTEAPSTLASQMASGGGLRVDFMHPSYTANGQWGQTLTWSGYNWYGMYQLAGGYGGATPSLAFRHEINAGSNTWSSWRTVLDSGNYTGYSPSLTGGGASGTWGINITGSAGSATNATNAGSVPWSGVTGRPNINPLTGTYGSVNISGTTNSYSGIYFPDQDQYLMIDGDGATGFYRPGYWMFYTNTSGDWYSSGYGWLSDRFAAKLSTGGGTMSGNLYFNNYGIGVVGTYSDVRYQGVFAMGDSYKLPADGTTPGSLYGIAWTHSNIGGQSKAGLSHQALFMENGVTKTAIGTGIWTAGGLTVSGSAVINGLNMNGYNISGVNKLTVSIMDPQYQIDGKTYATYGISMTGLKEETTGVVQLTIDHRQLTTCQMSNVKCQWSYVIDFSKVEQGSDLWLFAKVTDFGKEMANLTVLLTPGDEQKVWYKKDAANYQLVIYGDKEGEVSYRLTAPRFDSAKWPNEVSKDKVDGAALKVSLNTK